MSVEAIHEPILGLDYRPLIGAEGVNRIARKAARLSNLRITHVSSTYYGGGVAEILSPLTLLMNACGISTDWHIIRGHPVFLL